MPGAKFGNECKFGFQHVVYIQAGPSIRSIEPRKTCAKPLAATPMRNIKQRESISGYGIIGWFSMPNRLTRSCRRGLRLLAVVKNETAPKAGVAPRIQRALASLSRRMCIFLRHLLQMRVEPVYPPLSIQVEVILRAVSPKTEQNRSSIRTGAPGTSVRLGVLRHAFRDRGPEGE
jgi:hypothetical protein